MKVVNIFLRFYFLLISALGLDSIVRFSPLAYDWTIWFVLSVVVFLFIIFASLAIAWKWEYMLTQRLFFVEGVLVITMLNSLSSAYIGWLGLNRYMESFRQFGTDQLVGLLMYIVLYTLLMYLTWRNSIYLQNRRASTDQ